MLAGVGAGVCADVDQAAEACVSVVRRQDLRPERKQLLDDRCSRWTAGAVALQSVAGR